MAKDSHAIATRAADSAHRYINSSHSTLPWHGSSRTLEVGSQVVPLNFGNYMAPVACGVAWYIHQLLLPEISAWVLSSQSTSVLPLLPEAADNVEIVEYSQFKKRGE